MKIKTTNNEFSEFDNIKERECYKLLKFTLENNITFTCTPEHKIFIDDDIPIWAELLSINEFIKYNNGFIKIINIEEIISNKLSQPFKVYDIINVKNDNKFIINNGIISHNCDSFWTSNYPTISASTTSKIIIISTPNGLFNTFHNLYEKAWDLEEFQKYEKCKKEGVDFEFIEWFEENIKIEKRNNFVRRKYDWRKVDWRDDKWKDDTTSAIGKIKFQQEYECVGEDTKIVVNDEEMTIKELWEKI